MTPRHYSNFPSPSMLPHKATITRSSYTQDDYMTSEESTESLRRNVRCRVVPATAYERFVNERQGEEITHKLVMRPVSDINVGDTVTFDTRTFRIQGTIDDHELGRLQVLKLLEEK